MDLTFGIKRKIDSYISDKAQELIDSKPSPTATLYYHNILSFDGERTPYELGTAYDFSLDYYTIRKRSWEAFLKTDFIQNAIKKYCLWVVGSGLKLQSEPVMMNLKNEGVNISEEQLKNFTDLTESKFRLFSNSKQSSYSTNDCLHDIAYEATKNAIVAGDVLCITRFDGKRVNLQILDGNLITDPIGSEYYDQARKIGNYIYKGVEIDKTGKHVAFYVIQDDLTYKRILAHGSKTGRLQAWLMYGLKGKLNDTRGMSLLTAILETASKMDRYKDATIGSAEENAKIPYTIDHGPSSDGENPMMQMMGQSFGKGKGVAPETKPDNSCEVLATKISLSTNKQVYNLPVDTKLSRHTGSSDINFEGFWKPNIAIVYATLGIPPEVAADQFGGAYSGSRAALMAWQYKMLVDRTNILKRQFYYNFYAYWLDIEVWKGKIDAPGYFEALENKNHDILDSYRNCRFIGTGVPHIDPVKEANAQRIQLGKGMDNMPLTTVEQAMESLGNGDVEPMLNKIKNETQLAKDIIDRFTVNNGE